MNKHSQTCQVVKLKNLYLFCSVLKISILFFFQFYNDYGDIIKATLGKAREINKVQTAKTLAVSLTQLFRELQQDYGHRIDRGSEAFQAIKELARRFSLSFGLDQVRNRDAVAAMHK